MSRSLPGPGDVCHGCNRLLCQCQPEPDVDAHLDASYEAGYDACLADGYASRPMTEWIYRTGSRSVWNAHRQLVHHMTPRWFTEITWRHRHASAWAYARWFERQYGFDLDAYLEGFDDAGAGLPSAVAEPALDAYDPTQAPRHIQPQSRRRAA